METTTAYEDIRTAVREVIASVADVPLDTVPTSGPYFEVIGLDSMMVVAIAVEIQERFDVTLPKTRTEMIALNSIDAISQYVARALEQGVVDGRV